MKKKTDIDTFSTLDIEKLYYEPLNQLHKNEIKFKIINCYLNKALLFTDKYISINNLYAYKDDLYEFARNHIISKISKYIYYKSDIVDIEIETELKCLLDKKVTKEFKLLFMNDYIQDIKKKYRELYCYLGENLNDKYLDIALLYYFKDNYSYTYEDIEKYYKISENHIKSTLIKIKECILIFYKNEELSLEESFNSILKNNDILYNKLLKIFNENDAKIYILYHNLSKNSRYNIDDIINYFDIDTMYIRKLLISSSNINK